jgi:ribosomal protein S18 acetylase RimI-like enzyme
MTTTTRTADPTRIQKATGADLPRIATTLARAFFDDPVFRWTCPDEQRRRRLLPAFFALIAETLQRHDEIHLSADATGAALWAPPGQPPVPDEQADALGRRLEQIAGVDADRILAISKLIDEHHPPGSYYFLQFIGVEPTGQGRGTGSALRAQMLERCDQQRARLPRRHQSAQQAPLRTTRIPSRRPVRPRRRPAALADVARTGSPYARR